MKFKHLAVAAYLLTSSVFAANAFAYTSNVYTCPIHQICAGTINAYDSVRIELVHLGQAAYICDVKGHPHFHQINIEEANRDGVFITPTQDGFLVDTTNITNYNAVAKLKFYNQTAKKKSFEINCRT